MELDLMCVAPNAPVPVCKILDYGRYHFEDQKKQREAKKNQHVTEVKALRLSPVIDQHDFETKLKRSREWIEAGQKSSYRYALPWSYDYKTGSWP